MSLFRTAVLAAAAYGVYRLLTDRDAFTGKTVIEDLRDKAEGLTSQAKAMKDEIVDEVKDFKRAADGNDDPLASNNINNVY